MVNIRCVSVVNPGTNWTIVQPRSWSLEAAMRSQSIASHAVMENSGQSFGECFICPNCFASFEGQFLYHQHLSSCHSYTCRSCGKTVRYYDALKSHVRNQHQLQIHRCRACLYITYCSSDEAMHKLQSCSLNGLYECETCIQVFLTFTALQRHDKVHLNDYQFPCRYCSFTHTHRSHSEMHMSKHTTLLEMFRCPYCAWSSKIREPVTRHIKKVHIGRCETYKKLEISSCSKYQVLVDRRSQVKFPFKLIYFILIMIS